MHIRTLFLLVIVLHTVASGRTLRSCGTFPLKHHPAPAAMDIYSSRLAAPGHNSATSRLRCILVVEADFSPQAVEALGGTILRREGTRLFISCTQRSLAPIAALSGVVSCSLSRKADPLMDSARIQCHIDEVHGTRPSVLSTHFSGKGVITGILDTEFDTRHPAFLDSNGNTRFLAIWDQKDSTGAKLNRFGYGTIKQHAELLADTAFGLGHGSHGSHTSSTMAGSDRSVDFYGAAPGASIVAARYEGSIEIADALTWICSLADSLGMPCVINMSIGLSSGPHDGTSLVDHTIDSLSGPGHIIVGAVGNDGAKYTHVQGTIKAGQPFKTWAQPKIDSADGTINCITGVDFWGEAGNNFSATFYIMNRRTSVYRSSQITVATSLKKQLFEEDTVYWVDSATGAADTFFLQYGVERANPDNNKPHMVAYSSTGNPDLLLGFEITTTATTPATIHGWNIPKLSFHHFGVEGWVMGDTTFTVNEVGGTAKRIITVGAYVGKTVIPLWNGTPFLHDNGVLGDIFVSSGVGPTVDGRIKPDITAPGWSVVAAVSRTGSREQGEIAVWPDTTNTLSRYGGATGTSMAAPVVAGIIALLLEIKPALTPEEARTILMKTAINDGFTGDLTVASNKWGAGKVNALAAVGELLGITGTAPQSRTAVLSSRPRMYSRKNRLIIQPDHHEQMVLQLFDLRGRSCIRKEISRGTTVQLVVDLPPGMYTATLTGAHSGTVTRMKTAVLP